MCSIAKSSRRAWHGLLGLGMLALLQASPSPAQGPGMTLPPNLGTTEKGQGYCLAMDDSLLMQLATLERVAKEFTLNAPALVPGLQWGGDAAPLPRHAPAPTQPAPLAVQDTPQAVLDRVGALLLRDPEKPLVFVSVGFGHVVCPVGLVIPELAVPPPPPAPSLTTVPPAPR